MKSLFLVQSGRQWPEYGYGYGRCRVMV